MTKPETAMSSRQCDVLDCSDRTPPKSSSTSSGAATSSSDCDKTTTCNNAPPTSYNCGCVQSDILRIDNHPKGLHVDIHRGLFRSKDLDNSHYNNNWHQKLLDNVRWHRVKYKSNRFQNQCETPCWTAFYGGRSEYAPYTPIPSWFQPLIDRVTSHLVGNGGVAVKFNAFLLRLYFDGNDEIAWHTDGRTFLGEEPTIASLSLGCKATFQLRRMNDVWPCADGSKSTKGCIDVDTPIENFVLDDGDLLVMRGTTQRHWHHRVPKEKGRGLRLNINFRYVMPGPDAERGQRTYYKYMVYGDCPMDRDPPGWTFDEIVAKRGGMMTFVQRGIKQKKEKIEKCAVGEAGRRRQLKEKQGGVIDLMDEESMQCETTHTKVSATGSSSSCISPSNGSKSISGGTSTDTQKYLASDSSVDPEVFMALPMEIQRELVSQWKSQQKHQSTIIISPTTLTPKTVNVKRKQNNSVSALAIGKKTCCRKGTLDSFFAKKG